MKHIADGDLHAYLDGAPEHMELTGGSAALERHVAECAACRARLDAERLVRERAIAILRGGAPLSTARPPFEEVGGSAGVVAPRRSVLRGRPLAWAATIVIALGTGWVAREVLRSPGGDPGMRVAATRVESRAETGTTAPAGTGTETGTRAAGGAPVARRSDPPMESAPVAMLESRAASADPAVPEPQVPEPAVSTAASPEPPPSVPPGPPPPRVVVAGRITDELAPAAVALSEIVVTGVGADTARTPWRTVGIEEAEDALGRPVVHLPHLPITEIELGGSDAHPTVRVTHCLEDGAAVQLEQWRDVSPRARRAVTMADAGATREIDAAEADGEARVSLRIDDLVIEARAAIPLSRLRALLDALR